MFISTNLMNDAVKRQSQLDFQLFNLSYSFLSSWPDTESQGA